MQRSRSAGEALRRSATIGASSAFERDGSTLNPRRRPPIFRYCRISTGTPLPSSSMWETVVRRELRLAPIHGTSLARLGVTAELASGSDYERSQLWSRALWEHSDRPDGVLYRSRHDDSALCVAVFDRAKDILAIVRDEPTDSGPQAQKAVPMTVTTNRGGHYALDTPIDRLLRLVYRRPRLRTTSKNFSRSSGLSFIRISHPFRHSAKSSRSSLVSSGMPVR